MQPLVLQAAPSSRQIVQYRRKSSLILGGFHLALGVLCVILSAVGFFLFGPFDFQTGYGGIFAGVFVSDFNDIYNDYDSIIYTHTL